jgi:hypothetical protein
VGVEAFFDRLGELVVRRGVFKPEAVEVGWGN